MKRLRQHYGTNPIEIRSHYVQNRYHNELQQQFHFTTNFLEKGSNNRRRGPPEAPRLWTRAPLVPSASHAFVGTRTWGPQWTL